MSASTESEPRKGGNFVTKWNVGINHRPAIPSTSRSAFCQVASVESSPLYLFSIDTTSTLPFSSLEMRTLNTQRLAKAGRNSPAAYAVGVTTPLTQSMTEVISPMAVKHPPMLADNMIVHA